jgi:hypothetical protein
MCQLADETKLLLKTNLTDVFHRQVSRTYEARVDPEWNTQTLYTRKMYYLMVD